MADSYITKRALAAAFKSLLETKSFSKISISDICEKCEMNRKSFYYHFKDKYDLVNWIYYTEFVAAAREKKYNADWERLDDLCGYFYENREFYRKTFGVDGQNSFSDYFRDIVVIVITGNMEKIFTDDENLDFYVDFFTDAFVCAIKKWILTKDCIPADEFTGRLKKCLLGTSEKIAERGRGE